MAEHTRSAAANLTGSQSYREFAPPSHLSGVIDCVWTRGASPPKNLSAPAAHDVLPDGAMDIIATVETDGTLHDVMIVGAMTRPLRTTLSPLTYVGIRLLPGVGGSVLRCNAAELTNASIPLRDLAQHAQARGRMLDALRLLVREPSNTVAHAHLADQLRIEPSSTPLLVRRATRYIANEPRALRISALSRALNVSRQHLTRVFTLHTGLTPKQFLQVCRVRALLSEARVSSEPWSTLALDFGFSDQSHLIADVKSITGKTPGEWRAQTGSNFPIAPVSVGAF